MQPCCSITHILPEGDQRDRQAVSGRKGQEKRQDINNELKQGSQLQDPLKQLTIGNKGLWQLYVLKASLFLADGISYSCGNDQSQLMSDVTSFHVSSFYPCLFFMLTCFPDQARKSLYGRVQNSSERIFKRRRGAFGPEWRPVSKAAGPQARRVLSCLTCCYSDLSTSAVPHSSALWICVWAGFNDLPPLKLELLFSL